MTKPQARQKAREMANRFNVRADSAAINGAKVVEKVAPVKGIDPNLLLAVEYGFKGAERNWNLETTIDEFEKLFRSTPHGLL